MHELVNRKATINAAVLELAAHLRAAPPEAERRRFVRWGHDEYQRLIRPSEQSRRSDLLVHSGREAQP